MRVDGGEMVVEGVEVGEEVLQRAAEELEGFGVAVLLTPDQKLLPKHLQNCCQVETCYDVSE